MQKVYVVIPNWNGVSNLASCLEALMTQTDPEKLVVVDNASTDDSVELVKSRFPRVVVLQNKKNLGFAGGVNTGISHALDNQADAVALINNDAVAAKGWLKSLTTYLDNNPKVGIATSKIIDSQTNRLDSTGEQYTVWGLAYPRGRGEPAGAQYDRQTEVFGASGGASLYRAEMLRQIGLFDKDFFAYYEDVDLSFRAQLAGWRVAYVPQAVVNHQIGATGGKIKGFYTYQTLKNLPLLLWKNLPWALMPKVYWRFWVAWLAFLGAALARGQVWSVLKALAVGTLLWPKKLYQRREIQKKRLVSADYINSIIVHDLPPGALRLRRWRQQWRRFNRREGR